MAEALSSNANGCCWTLHSLCTGSVICVQALCCLNLHESPCRCAGAPHCLEPKREACGFRTRHICQLYPLRRHPAYKLSTRTPNTFCAHPERTQGRHYWALPLSYISEGHHRSMHPPKRTMGPTITQDVWLHIATFLSKEEIWCLRFLNHSFLRLALANRFSTLKLLSSLTQDCQRAHLCKFR